MKGKVAEKKFRECSTHFVRAAKSFNRAKIPLKFLNNCFAFCFTP